MHTATTYASPLRINAQLSSFSRLVLASKHITCVPHPGIILGVKIDGIDGTDRNVSKIHNSREGAYMYQNRTGSVFFWNAKDLIALPMGVRYSGVSSR